MIRNILIALVWFSSLVVEAQNEPVAEYSAFDGTWYMITEFQETKISMQGKHWTSMRLNEDGEASTTGRDTIEVIEAYPSGLRLMIDVKRKQYGLALLALNEAKNSVSITLIEEAETKDGLLAMAKEFDPSTVSEFQQSRIIYSEEKRNSIKAAPGLDEITAQDLEEVLIDRKMLQTKMEQDFAAKNPEAKEPPYRLYRHISEYMNRMFIEKGYNPYKQVPYNFEEQFKDNPTLMKLLVE